MRTQGRGLTLGVTVGQSRLGPERPLEGAVTATLQGRSEEGLVERRQGKWGEVDNLGVSGEDRPVLTIWISKKKKKKAPDACWPGLLF